MPPISSWSAKGAIRAFDRTRRSTSSSLNAAVISSCSDRSAASRSTRVNRPSASITSPSQITRRTPSVFSDTAMTGSPQRTDSVSFR
jgi:hypothetical protein